MSSKADPRIFIILGIFSAFFIGLGLLCTFKQPDGWELLAAAIVLLSFFWVGALSVRFRFDESEIAYRSLFSRFSMATSDVGGIAIVVERTSRSPQGIPRFYLQGHDASKQRLNVKVLPITVVRELCAMLARRGVSVSVQDAFMAKRMAIQIFPPIERGS